MKKTFIAAAALAGLLALSAHATGPAGQSAVTSGSQIVLSAGVNGGTAVGSVVNRQTATIEPSLNVGGAATVFGQSVGGAAVQGAGSTSTFTAGMIQSSGAAGGEIQGGGTSQVIQSQQNSYATGNGVKGTVSGSMALNSNSSLAAADNSGGVISAGAGAAYSATSSATRTGIFSSNRTATTTAGGLSTTTQPTTVSWGNSAFGLTNNSTITAGATAQSGSITSENGGNNGGNTGGGTGGNGGNGGGCQGSGNCGNGNGNGGGNGTGNEGGGNGRP